MTTKVGIFINPNAGSSTWESKVERTQLGVSRLRAMHYGGIETRTFPKTLSRDEFCEVIRDESKNLDLVVGGGGDGTVSDVLNNSAPHCIMGYMPMGSGNNMKLALFLSRLFRGNNIVNADLIVDDLDGKKSLFYGAGFDGCFMFESDQTRERGWRGASRYIPSLFTALQKFRPFDINLTVDQFPHRQTNANLIYLSSHQVMGKYVPIIPSAALDDGKIHCAVLKNGYRSKFRGNRFKAEFSVPQYVERDGEVVGLRDSISIHIEKGARKILTAKL